MFIAIVMSVGRSDAEPQGRDLPRALVGCWDTEPCPDFRRSLLWPSYADAERGEGVVRAVLIPAGEVLLPRVIQLVPRGTPVALRVCELSKCVPVRVVAGGR